MLCARPARTLLLALRILASIKWSADLITPATESNTRIVLDSLVKFAQVFFISEPLNYTLTQSFGFAGHIFNIAPLVAVIHDTAEGNLFLVSSVVHQCDLQPRRCEIVGLRQTKVAKNSQSKLY